MAWQVSGTPNTLSSASDDIDITDLTALQFNLFLVHTLTDSGTISNFVTFNNNSNTVYARRHSNDGAADTTAANESSMAWYVGTFADDKFVVAYYASISGDEKLGIENIIDRNTAGAVNAPRRRERVDKFVPSPDADITRIDVNNQGAGSYDTDSNVSSLATD